MLRFITLIYCFWTYNDVYPIYELIILELFNIVFKFPLIPYSYYTLEYVFSEIYFLYSTHFFSHECIKFESKK